MLVLVRRLARVAVAAILVIAGLLLSIPGVPGPGFVVVLIGLFVLLPESRWLRKKYVRFKQRHPRVLRAVERYRQRQRDRVKRRARARSGGR